MLVVPRGFKSSTAGTEFAPPPEVAGTDPPAPPAAGAGVRDTHVGAGAVAHTSPVPCAAGRPFVVGPGAPDTGHRAPQAVTQVPASCAPVQGAFAIGATISPFCRLQRKEQAKAPAEEPPPVGGTGGVLPPVGGTTGAAHVTPASGVAHVAPHAVLHIACVHVLAMVAVVQVVAELTVLAVVPVPHRNVHTLVAAGGGGGVVVRGGGVVDLGGGGGGVSVRQTAGGVGAHVAFVP